MSQTLCAFRNLAQLSSANLYFRCSQYTDILLIAKHKVLASTRLVNKVTLSHQYRQPWFPSCQLHSIDDPVHVDPLKILLSSMMMNFSFLKIRCRSPFNLVVSLRWRRMKTVNEFDVHVSAGDDTVQIPGTYPVITQTLCREVTKFATKFIDCGIKLSSWSFKFRTPGPRTTAGGAESIDYR